MLLAWCLPQKRAELLEAARGEIASARIGAQGTAMQLSLPADRQVHPIIASMLNSSPLGACSLLCLAFCDHSSDREGHIIIT